MSVEMTPSEDARRSPPEDVEKVLDLAEKLSDETDRLERIKDQYVFIAIVTLFGFGMVASFFFLSDLGDSFMGLTGFRLVAAGMYALFMLGFLFFWYQHRIRLINRRYRMERRALYEIVDLLRETEAILAQEQGWTRLERAQFRLRLSRFKAGRTSENY